MTLTELQHREADEFRYRHSRSHATIQLLEAMQGISPVHRLDTWRQPSEDVACKPVDARLFEFAKRVYAWDVRPDVTCPKCRALMRAIRPESALLYEVRPAISIYNKFTSVGRVYVVGGEFIETLAEFVSRIGPIPTTFSADDIHDFQISPGAMSL